MVNMGSRRKRGGGQKKVTRDFKKFNKTNRGSQGVEKGQQCVKRAKGFKVFLKVLSGVK